jgi:hypothetical protein
MRVMKPFRQSPEMKILLLSLALVIASAGVAQAQTGKASAPATRTMASLLSEGYETQTVQLFKDKIWMRKPDTGETGMAFICDRGRIGSAAFEAYRNRDYEQVHCSPAP